MTSAPLRSAPSGLSAPFGHPLLAASYISRLKRVDYVLVALIGLVSYFVFTSADKNFSYDYNAYIYYFNELTYLNFSELMLNALDQLPYPYVSLPPSGLFEIGFASLAWFTITLSGSASMTYAVIGATSIAVRTWLLRRMGVHWGWLLLINVFCITLFEANALRLGCAFTLFLLGVSLVLQRRSALVVSIVFLFACLFHLQIAVEVFFFLLVFYGYKLLLCSQTRLFMLIVLFVAFGAFAVLIIEQFGPSKLDVHVGQISESGGINIASSLGILIWASIFFHIFWIQKSTYLAKISKLDSRVWIAVVLAGVPALILYAFITNIGAIGERFWQVAFMSLASISFAGVWRQRIHRYQALLVCALLMAVAVNVLFRYPLSNFFYPLVPYTFIVPLNGL